MENNITLATELLHELKATSKRWFMAFLVMVVLEVATICGFLWYISLPVEDEGFVVTQSSDNLSRNLVIGGDSYGSTSDSGLSSQTESGKE